MKFGATHATEIGNYKSHAKAHTKREEKNNEIKRERKKASRADREELSTFKL